MSDEWIKNLAAGDKVYIDSSRFGSTVLDLTTVKKITPKGYVRTNDNNDSLFRNGWYRVDSWGSWHLVQWTQDLEDKLKAKAHFNQLAHSINAVDARTLTPDQVQKIYDIIKDVK